MLLYVVNMHMILMLLACIFLGRFPDFMVQHNLRQPDAGQRSVAFMLWTQEDVVVVNMDDDAVVEMDELVTEAEEELISIVSMFWT